MNRFKAFIVVLATAVAVTPAFAGEIDGVVRDSGGVPVAGATVRVQGSDLTTTTDDHGHFHFDDLQPGEYLVEVESDDIGTTEPVTVGDGQASIRVRLGAVATDRIVVRASPLRGRSPLDMAQPVTVLGGDELTRKATSSIGETVAAELGMSSTSFGQGASRPVIRGLGDDRVRVLDGGIGTLDVSSVSDDHGVTIEPILVDQVEILRGPATLLYGSGAIGGVVNVVDNRIPERMPAHGLEGRAEMRGQTVNDERTGVVRLDGRLSSRFAWHVDAWRRETGDFDIPGFAESAAMRAHEEEGAFGTVPNSDLRNQGGNVGMSWIGDRGFLGIAVSKMDNEYGVPGGHGHGHHDDGEDEGEDHDEEVRIDQEQVRFDIAGAFEDPLPGIERIRVRFGVNDYEHVELEGDEIGTVFKNDAWETRVELTHVPFAGGWHGAVGVQASGREFSAVGEEAFTPPVDSDELGLFVVEERDFSWAKFELGGRIGRVDHDPNAGPARAFTLVSHSGGVIVPFADDVELVANLGRYQRAPVAEELYSDGPHLATGTFELGNPGLRRERSTAIEVGLRDQRGELRWSVTAFRNDFDRFIFQQDTGVEDTESELPVFAYAQQGAEFTGVEAELIGRLIDREWGGLGFRVFTDTVRATLADGTPVPRIPPRRFGLALDYTRDTWFAQVDWTRHDDQSRVAPGELATPGFDIVNVDLNYRIDGGGTGWLLFLRGSNLLDEDARRHSSFLKDMVPLPGRSLQVGARVAF